MFAAVSDRFAKVLVCNELDCALHTPTHTHTYALAKKNRVHTIWNSLCFSVYLQNY